jgi:ribosomal protein S18 acetylase RimI-like enzyme
VWVADDDGDVAGFTAIDLPDGEQHGEIYMLAVDPGHQGKGIGLSLTQHAIGFIRDAGRTVVIVNTGGDPGHAPARATYERAGFTAMPSVSYYLTV